jgi:hypothetical protein
VARDQIDIWQDDYDDMVEGKGIYREYVEPDVEPDYGRMNDIMEKMAFTLVDLNHQEQLKKQRMEQLGEALDHWKYLTRGIKNG